MATIQKATLTGGNLEISVEVDQTDYNGNPSKGVTVRSVMGEAQVAAHMAEKAFADIVNAKLAAADKAKVADIVAAIDAQKAMLP